ncbi:IspD/TarI family cytidylyltransferase [Mycoplasmoides alvi]|uniref:IspD/TarI family cytidylyltransferase n=1 Tax=Mycoplasmoides alvi TaxID=78580 RepID=UPI00051B3213|nr:IspD/TarI family cytidylyltransferase [Mycoplasmoides alvi]
MNYVIILAAGEGKRLKNFKIPKQFIELNKNDSILSLAIQKFCIKEIKHILVVANKKYLKETQIIINNLKNKFAYIDICIGGSNRNLSLKNAIIWLNKNKKLNNDDILLTHDAARPFVSKKIILNNIKNAKKYGACSTGIQPNDTVAELNKNFWLTSILNRNKLILEQTPQSFNWKIAKKIYMHSNNKILLKHTDACGLIKQFKHKVIWIEGDYKNIKITNELDLKLANFIYKMTQRK